MTEVALTHSLRYFSFGLSSCIHILLLIAAFAGVYHHISSDYPASAQSADSDYDDTVMVYDGEDQPNDDQSTSQIMQTAQDEAPMQQEISLPDSSAPAEVTEPAADEPIIKRVVAPRRTSGINRWKKTTSSEQQQPQTGQQRVLTKAQQAGQKLQQGFGSYMGQEQARTAQRLAEHGTSVEDIGIEREEYHKRVLNAIKIATQYFVKHYYTGHSFTTPQVRVQFSLNEHGSVTALSITPSTGNKDLDEAIRSFVMSAKFAKKPQKLLLLPDQPYDFYILPLSIQQGENFLKLVPCF